ncbi:TIGR04222 domain-containing membrane protein [Actinokineospora sp. NBRC 105648]|uniref:TIGR04222 domain-containing membrane protein n=1 Tax=Actinokineospora sp. NBRC 105648 TaxID=3032206 RepID=UPI0024A4E863|nr:TIGR04222 domain-containing membrane protein [Actinokineospora sp. NBRC 105648]GLZ40138.1 hypothetical protein Acsp05_37620 [Actinokineospora sp. NBRC 105648]
MFWVWLAVFVAVCAYPVYLLWRDRQRLGHAEEIVERLDLDRPGVALLTGGPARVADALVTDLVEREVLVVHEDARGYFVQGEAPAADAPAVIRAIFERVGEHGARLTGLREEMSLRCEPDLRSRYQAFQREGLVASSSARSFALVYGYGILASMVGFFIGNLLTGTTSEDLDERPGTMLALCFALAIVPSVILYLRRDTKSWPSDPRTRLGQAVGRLLSKRAADSLDLAPVVAARGLKGSDELTRSILGGHPVGAWDMYGEGDPDDYDACYRLTKNLTWHRYWNARG